MPQAHESTGTAPRAKQPAAAESDLPRILLVDDRPANLLSLEAILDSLAVQLVRATSAEEALAAVGQGEFAVILLDVQMPGMDGYEVVRRIKALEAPRVTPVIFLTALDEDRRHVRAGYESGAMDYLFKPLDPDVLRAKVRAFAAMNVARHSTERTARERAEAAEGRLAEIFELAPAFIAVLRGPDHAFELANAAFYQIVGHREIIGKPAREALPEIRGQGFIELLDDVARSGKPLVGTEQAITIARAPDAAPERRFIDFVYQPLRETNGDCVGIFVHGVDVTEQVLARTEVEMARAEAEAALVRAEEANNVKSQFVATMSHELRTPLNAQIGYAQLLEMGIAGPLTPEQQRYVQRLMLSSGHLLTLINDILDFSKIEAGELSPQRDEIWTGVLVRDALNLVRPQAEARGVRLIHERQNEEGVPFVGDEQRVRQILLNLLSNGVKFTDRGGRILVSCETSETASPMAQVHGAGPWAFLRVEDTGIGVATEQLVHIFDPFHQVDSSHTRQQGGTGLGLAISRRLARAMGGDLTAESTPGIGSVFTLWLPSVKRVSSDGDGRGTNAETAAARAARAERPMLGMEDAGLDVIGELLRGMTDDVMAAYAERLRLDPELPQARLMRRPELEDHGLSMLADMAQTLVIVSEAGSAAAELLRDGSVIQRTIAEQHGIRRYAQGWSEAGVRRDHQVFREEIERAVRSRIRSDVAPAKSPEVEEAVELLLQLVDKAETISAASWRRAARDET
jgi:signal transduction histidine kinase/CheY-like chemotaxis protein